MVQDITAEELKERINKQEKITLIDVREEWEYDELNINARNIPLATLPEKIGELAALKDHEIIVHCKSGNRSRQAKKYLSKQGFNKVRSLLEGIEGYLK